MKQAFQELSEKAKGQWVIVSSIWVLRKMFGGLSHHWFGELGIITRENKRIKPGPGVGEW